MCTCCSMTNGVCDLGLPTDVLIPDPPITVPTADGVQVAAASTPYGPKWGEPVQGAPGGVVTWSVAGAGETMSDLGVGRSVDPGEALDFDFEAQIQRAFDAWADIAGIDFLQIEDQGGGLGEGAMADIRIFHGATSPGWVGAYANPVYRQNGEIPARAGDINMNPNKVGPDRYFAVLLHEIGHSLGLGHVDYGQVSIMTPIVRIDYLSASDAATIQSIYGAPDDAAPVYSLPAREQQLRVLEVVDGLTIEGNDRTNRIEGGAGDEIFVGGGGDDTLIGGAGLDTAVAAIPRAEATLTVLPKAVTVTGAGGETDRLVDIERIAFTDGLLALDSEDSGLGLVYRLYNAAFGREADAGVLFWQEAYLDGESARGLAAAFVESEEFEARFGANPPDEAYVDALFSNVLGRLADTEGRAFWLGELEAGRARADMLLAFADSAENVAATADALVDGLFFQGYEIA